MSKISYFEELVDNVKRSNRQSDSHGLFKQCYTFPDYVVLKKRGFESELNRLPKKPAKQQKAISMIKQLGFKTPNIVYYTQNSLTSMLANTIKGNDYYEVQERAKGSELIKRDTNYNKKDDQIKDTILKILSAPTSQIAEYLDNFFIGYQLGILFDAHGSNVFYDEKEGFTFIDLPKIPYKSSLDEYKKEIYQKHYEPRDFISQASNRLSLYTECSDISYYKPYSNILHNRLLEALEETNIPITESQYSKFKNYLCPEIGSYGSFSNEEQKLFLDYLETGKCGEINKYSELYPKNGFTLPSNYFGLDRRVKETNTTFLNECLDATTIRGVPAREFYDNLDQLDIKTTNYDGIDFEY